MVNELQYHRAESEIADEQKWVEAALADPAKFEMLYNKYYEPILKFVYKRVEGKETAFDITSQVFLNAMVSLKSYHFKGKPFSSWLYRIALNEINQLYRKDKIKRMVKIEVQEIDSMMDEMDIHKEQEIKHQQIAVALTQLDNDDLQLVEMRFFEKRPFKEIAEILNITEVNAKVKMYRIIEKLKKSISKAKV